MTDEIDYMSDEFIAKCLDDKSDIRPGLPKTRREQREHDLIKKRKLEAEQKKPSPKVLEMEVLQEGLKQPINSSNKGFSMLQKMGFKSGMGLGKNSDGMVEPIAINIKNEKLGLGHKKASKPIQAKKESNNKLENLNEDDYRAFLSKKNRDREVLSDLKKSQRVCAELDSKSNKNKPEESWFWPEEEAVDTESEENEDVPEEKDEVEYSNEEKLQMITEYLRRTYFYCVWCKVKYNDEKDMEDCPGTTRDDH